MKVFVLCVGLVVVASFVSAAAHAQRRRAAAPSVNGRAVYEAKCARCHGADGAGHTRLAEIVEPPDMTDPNWQRRRSSARMIASVSNGRGQMPAFRKKLTQPEIAAAVAHVRTFGR